MKSVLTACAIGLAIVIGSLLYTHNLEKISEQLLIYNQNLEVQLEAESFDNALEQLAVMEGFLEKQHAVMEATGKHGSMNEIRKNMIELRSYIECKAKNESITKNKSLKFLFKDLPENFYIRIENIL